MTCHRVGIAIVCTRGARRPSRRPPPQCRRPGCDRNATQAGYACRAHWFKLPLDLRARMFRAATAGPGVPQTPAWQACAAEADAWYAEQAARPPGTSWRQPELPL